MFKNIKMKGREKRTDWLETSRPQQQQSGLSFMCFHFASCIPDVELKKVANRKCQQHGPKLQWSLLSLSQKTKTGTSQQDRKLLDNPLAKHHRRKCGPTFTLAIRGLVGNPDFYPMKP